MIMMTQHENHACYICDTLLLMLILLHQLFINFQMRILHPFRMSPFILHMFILYTHLKSDKAKGLNLQNISANSQGI